MNREIKLLDHGYVRVVETWGSDERIIEAARMSTAKGFEGWGPKHVRVPSKLPSGGETIETRPGDEKLLRFLWENAHATPFEMAGAIIEVQAPIFVFREWHRHRTQSYNEMSARYTPLPDVSYMPTIDRCLVVNGANKQANAADGASSLTHEQALDWLEDVARIYEQCEAVYQKGLRIGIPKEVARIVIPVGRYSRMRASANLRNWLAFLTLRSDRNVGAQWEIRQYGNAVHELLAPVFPRTVALFDEGTKR